ncbi:Wzy polymerase domain-containing protein [Halomonas sp. SSL-5]|uniref:PglL family O-oligosaccharyltransferase n=1 Tax=Halomonas sp. SSL-5 TaxID=3065855 RepID=UPI00273A3A8C|nr:Wzy polymerase domain-containing protein [Halomonas sp. SSL-5]MDY7116733.1 Wzy polymerase domain-containing protein [Halomonas sp. SSL-5]
MSATAMDAEAYAHAQNATHDQAPNPRLRKAFIITAFVTFTVLLHVTFPNLGGTGLRMPHNAAVWMGFGVMMAIAMWPASRGVIRFSAFHKGLGLLLLALWLPFLWSWNEASLIALPRMLTVTAGAILLLGIAQLQLTRRDWWWIGMAILSGVLLETAFGYVQHFVLQSGNWLGYPVETGRPYGVFQQVNVMASFLATGLVISAWLFAEARSNVQRGITLLAPLFIPFLLLTIASRSGFLGTLIAVPLVMGYLWHQDRARFKQWSGALLAGIVIATALFLLTTEGGGAVARKLEQGGGERIPVYLHSLKMIVEEPLTGWGYGRFQHDFLHSFADWRAALPQNQPEIVDPIITQTYAHPHNELLYWGIEGGLLPLLGLVGFGSWVFWRLITNGPAGERLLLAALLLPLVIHSMLELPFYHSQGHWLVLLVLMGMVARKCWQEKEKENRSNFGVRTGGVLIPAVLIVFMCTHFHTLWQTKRYVETKGEEYQALTNVINPFGVGRTLEFLVMSQQLGVAAELEMVGMVNDYLAWAEDFSRLKPSPVLYANMIRAETRFKIDDSRSLTIIKKSHHLFPYSREIHLAMEKGYQDKSNSAASPSM